MTDSLPYGRAYLSMSNCFARCFGCLLVLMLAPGCTNTLMFGEQTSFDLAIHVNNDPVEPVKVNAGLKRHVVAVVPPRQVERGEDSTVAADEAVNLFSGFKLKHEDTSVLNPFAGKLTIRTQFASGAAALEVASDPSTVRKIVDVQHITFTRDEDFAAPERQARINELLDKVGDLQADRAISLASNPPVTDPDVERAVAARDPQQLRRTSEEVAREIVKMRLVLSQRDDAALAAWEAAITAAQ